VSSTVPFEADGVRGVLHAPDGARERGLVLTHGAGADCQAPLLVALATAFCAAGWCVLRCDLPFRQRRASGPPHPAGAAADRSGLAHALAALSGHVRGPVWLGGHSYGGRQASMLAADDPAVAPALLLLSYPLHPPKRPDKPRTEHFPRLRVPCVFVHGTSDGFATPAELAAAVALIPARTTVIPIAGAGHDLKRGRFDLAPVIAAL